MILTLNSQNLPSALLSQLRNEGITYYIVELYGQPRLVLPKGASNFQDQLLQLDEVVDVYQPKHEYMLVDKALIGEGKVQIGADLFGGKEIFSIAGPCSAESEQQLTTVAQAISELGIRYFRAGAYKPRTSPYRFQGHGLKGLQMMRKVADNYNLKVVTEVLDSTLIEEVTEYADVLQVGSRNMNAFHFLKLISKADKPILLKRGMYSTIEEWLLAAEYLLLNGNDQVILCERGVRGFDPATRNIFDITAIPLAKELTHLPVMADPSHGTGYSSLVGHGALAAIAAGADGVMLEVHPEPKTALSDAEQAISLDELKLLYPQLKAIAAARDRQLI